ncbi:MAG: hypothetical protein JWM80_5293 [Cyanobacteria bacterium RYN_339]|nr:hypothetical protein [Cyanobacteria bacterium RYN_339]
MSACIYHDAEAVAICPSCDFGVCQTCMDQGSEGVCSTCSEERDMRRQHSALQREYTVEEQVARCNYCRAQADEETPLDGQGYCPTCSTLARCCLHDDLIAVGHCKSCRKEYCRKCLGFTDVCQSCTAKNKSRPTKAAPPSTVKNVKKRAAGTSPMKESASGRKDGEGRRRDETAALKGGGTKSSKNAPAEPENGEKKKKKAPTRGMIAMEAKMAAKAPAPKRFPIIAAALVGAVGVIVFLSGTMLNASSPEGQLKLRQEEMVKVHRGVIQYYKDHGKLPSKPDQIVGTLRRMDVKGAEKLKIAMGMGQKGSPPNTILYAASGATFMVLAADDKGKVLLNSRGQPLSLDQSYDSSAGQ